MYKLNKNFREVLKKLRHILIFLLLLQFSLLSALSVNGQTVPRPVQNPADTLTTPQDTVNIVAPQGDIATTIKYSARDSILFEVDRKVVHLYGDAAIDYGTMSLKAAYIAIDYDATSLTATSLTDSLGKEIGVPVFADGGETYSAKRIAYNYKTKRGVISKVVTQQGEGYIHAEVVKKNEAGEFYGLHAKYTTCNLEHPHFYINASKIKAIPNDKVMAGPFNLVFADIPLPVGFLFGLFPTPRNKRSSGILVPTYGETRARGFSLSNGGYYLALNDYIGTSITGDIYSLGGYKVNLNNTYIKRYSYTGSLNLSYDYFKNDEALIEQSRSAGDRFALPPTTRSIWINWNHSPVTKPGRGRFTASVNAGSSLFQRLNMMNTSQYLSPTFNSSIAYQKTIPNSPFSYGISLRQSQQNGFNSMNFVLPDMNFAMTQMSVYELLTNNTSTGAWYENFTFGYNLNFSNNIATQVQGSPGTISAMPLTNGSSFPTVEVVGGATQTDTLALNLNNLGRIWQAGRRQANHNFSIGLGNYKVLNYFNLTPSVSYNEIWVDRQFTYRYNADSNKVEIDTTNFGRIYQYNAGLSLSTNVYGTVYVKGKRVEAIRHIMRPNISYSFSPDYGNRSFGYFQEVQVGVDAETNEPIYGRIGRFGSLTPGGGLQSGLSFGIQNNIEMKVRAKSDTADAKFEKVSLIDNLGISTFYNFAGESFKLSPINVNMNTSLFKLFNLNATATFDPYQTETYLTASNELASRRIDKYMLEGDGFKLARLTNANLGIQASFNPASQSTSTAPPQNLPMLEPEAGPVMGPAMPAYIDFKIPWTLSVDFTLFYSRPMAMSVANFTKTFGMQGSVNLTEKWKISYSGNYDFSQNNIAHASVNIHRDLHCWDMSISWIPFGFAQGYNLTINARSSILQDLKLTRNRLGWNR